MSKARDLANAGTALGAVTATELGYVDGVTSAIQTQIDAKEATLPSQTGNSGKYLTTNGTAKSWGTVSQYALPTQTGNSGKYLTTNGTAESWGTVTSPTTFTNRLSSAVYMFYAIAYNESNLWVAVGANGILYSSPDGITWTSRTSGFGTTNIRDVAYGNGLWVAVGDTGTLTTSTDGATWTARTANMSTNRISAVRYANSIWVAVGQGGGSTNTGGIIYSTDGITWTRKSQTPNVGTAYHSVVYNGTNWIVGATFNASNNYLYASDPSGTWTVGHSGSGDTIYNIYWDGTRHITQENVYNIFFSTSTTLGTTTQYNNMQINPSYSGLQPVWPYSDKIYFTNGAYLVSFTSASSVNPTQQAPILLPNTLNDTTIQATVSSIWIGAAGIIVATSAGFIWTSF
jgi:hypothetical protein